MGIKLTLHSITIRHCKDLEKKFEIAAECGYDGVDLEETDVIRYLNEGHTSEDLIELADWAKKYEITLAYEFLGFAKQIKDLSMSWEIISRANRDNISLCIDTFHIYKGKSHIDDISAIPKKKILFVHINDAKERPVEQHGDYDRVFPGDGVLPVKEVLQALRNISYDGFYSIEIYNEDYWKEDPEEIAIKAKEKTENIFAQLR